MITREHASKAGLASGLARQTPEMAKSKAEAVRLHTELDYGLAVIGRLLFRPRNVIRRWLIQAGVYRTGHRSPSRNYGTRRGPWQYTPRPIDVLKHQMGAWRAEWAGMLRWDETAHWLKYPGVEYIRRADKIRERVADYYATHKHDAGWKAKRLAAAKEYNRQRRIARGILPRTPRDRAHAKFAKRLRSEVNWFLARNKPSSRLGILGCTRIVLMQWLESQFSDGMGWHNKNTRGGNDAETWQIDHIKPCASFDLTRKQDRLNCFHYTNLRPLWSCDNHAKGARHHTESADM